MRTAKQIDYKPEMVDINGLTISKYNTRYNRIDTALVERLKKSITKRGYDENFPLLVAYIGDSEKGEVLGGAHRFVACKELGDKDKAPANVYRGITPEEAVSISYENNQNQKTFQPETFIDLAYQIHRLNSEDGKSLEVIGGMFGMSKSAAGHYNAIVQNLATDVLQRVEDTLSNTFSGAVDDEGNQPLDEKANALDKVDWSLRWFQYITPLRHKYQRMMVDKIIANKGNLSKKAFEEAYTSYKGRQFLEDYFKENVPKEHLGSHIERLDEGTYDRQFAYDKKTKIYTIKDSLISTIEALKRESSSRLENKDCLEVISTLLDKSIDCLLTDPPYGTEYKSNRKQDVSNDLHKPIEGDTEVDAIKLISDCLAALDSKMKDDSHCYIFCDWEMYPQVTEIVKQYFEIKNLLIWYKNNHGAGDLKGSYAPIYECVIFGVKGGKKLQGDKRIPDVLEEAKISSKDQVHPTEKPVPLLKTLLDQSCNEGEVVIDPFAGSGTTLEAAKSMGIGYIGCEVNDKNYELAKLRLAGNE